jgi:RNA polymerase sigma-70 factor (ECF subfamily)
VAPESRESDAPPLSSPSPAQRNPTADLRLTGIVRQHYGFLWRSLRRLGVYEADVDDAAQRVLEVIARRLSEIDPRAEKSFMFQTALRVAADVRRAKGRAKTVADEDTLARATDTSPTPEEVLHRKQARAELDVILDQMALDLRAVFVLFELEEMSTSEIAAMLGIPGGTVSSRLHRAREEFQSLAARARAARAKTPQGRRA